VTVINLNKARKAKVRDDARRQADVNAVKHGLTKAAKVKAKAEQAKTKRDLDGHARE
jgi:hypothetical protein